ncbi:MAG TPA: hypothetical protein VFT22_07995 [Kofleriaceae bacterium]|nr:hypothetical protein [Kofleriaceae bacterium]
MTFDSYHWRGAVLGTPELERARALVSSSQDRASFEQLLRSDDVAAVGIALDQYRYGEATERWGVASPFAQYRDEVAARARRVLREPPSPGSERALPGANHASALNALANLIEPEDAGLVVSALAGTPTADVRCAATAAAGYVLRNAADPDERLTAALEKIVFDDALPSGERIDALGSLANASAAVVTAILLRVLELPDVKLQAHAALHLLDRDQGAHREVVQRVAHTWPADPPYPADEVLDALA